MAQLPAEMRRRKPATTSIHEKPPSTSEKMLGWGSWVLLCLAILALCFGGYAIYQRIATAKIVNVQVNGVSSASADYLKKYLGDELEGSYFTTNLTNIRDKSLTLSWVDRIVVARVWPDQLMIDVTPRHPIARWGTGRLLSDDGVIFKPVQAVPTQHLSLLHGPVSQSKLMMNKYRDINQMFAPLNLRLKELYLTERMTWFMQFDSGLRVVVDQDQTMSKLQRLSDLSRSDLKPVWSKIAAIDLRYRNGLAIQWKNSQPPKISNGQFVIVNSQTDTVITSGGTP